jgi:cytoskeletal protein CcmA (bactofilin family)
MANQKKRKEVILKRSTHLSGQVDTNVVVGPGINVQLHGVVSGDVILHIGSELVIHGRVEGNVTNLGGVLVIFGEVAGEIKGKVTAR